MYKFNGFTEKASRSLNLAIGIAQQLGHTYIGSEHVLYGLAKEGTGVAAQILSTYDITAQKLESLMTQAIGIGNETSLSHEDFTPRCQRIVEMSLVEARRLGHTYVGTEHLLSAIIKEGDSYAVKFIKKLGVTPSAVLKSIMEALCTEDAGEETPPQTNIKQPRKSGKTPTLEKFGRELTTLAKQGLIDPVIGRHNEIERVIQVLSRRTKNNPCLIGEPGVGKTAIAEGLALKIAHGEVPETLKGKKIYALDLTGMVAGTKYRGDFEDRIKNILDEIKGSDDIIVFIDEIHTLVGAGAAEGAVDAANILKPSLARGELHVIGATTLSEYRKHIEKDSALERRFQPVTVGEPTEDEAIEILKGLRPKYEAHHKVKISDEAITAAVKLSARYIADRFLPDKAIDLIDEAGSRIRLRAVTAPPDIKALEDKLKKIKEEKSEAVNLQDFESAAKLRDEEKHLKEEIETVKGQWAENTARSNGEVTAQEIAEIVSSWTGVPVSQLTKEESEKLLNLEEQLHKRIIGQDEAVKAVSKAIRRGRVGLKNPNRPTGSFIFLGPTGVGKTEVCKALAQTMFGSESAMIRLDMSEYMEKHTVSKMIGSPPGYVGYDEGGQLTEKIRRKPYCVLLFDEIEKAHPDVFNMLLQILEDGILTDAQGRKVDFKNTVIIMTSNVGASLISDKRRGLGFAADDGEVQTQKHTRELINAELKKTFRPEFLNRIDDIIIFNHLTEVQIKEIARNMLGELSSRAQSMDINLSFSDSVIAQIASVGFDESYGARPLRRAIQSEIEDMLSEEILKGNLKSGENYICDFVDNSYKIVVASENS
ncbi:MAG: ATP-dependent Clp protease ATP-binding subunit [Clostridia bacterium]|nr:ATP-dependent Clp protease ATP-binding subunit [Clostridia bacterium]